MGSVGAEKEKPGGEVGPQGAGFGLWEKEPGWVGASGRVRLRYLAAGREDPKARGRGGRLVADVPRPQGSRMRISLGRFTSGRALSPQHCEASRACAVSVALSACPAHWLGEELV